MSACKWSPGYLSHPLSTSKNDRTTSSSNSSLFSKLQSSSLSKEPWVSHSYILSAPIHLTRHSVSANQGGRGASPPNMDLFTPPALHPAGAIFQVRLGQPKVGGGHSLPQVLTSPRDSLPLDSACGCSHGYWACQGSK
jgi:hypothetical protein